MKIFQGKYKLGVYKGRDVFVDYDELLKYGGDKGGSVDRARNSGRILLALCILSFLGFISIQLLNGELLLVNFFPPKDVGYLFPTILVPIILYSFYLRRNREEFFDTLESLNLSEIKYQESLTSDVRINDTLTFSVSSLLDELYYRTPDKFLVKLLDSILHHRNVKIFLERRLGVEMMEFREAASQYLLTKEVAFDKTINDLLLRSLNEAIQLECAKIDENVFFFVLIKYYLQDVLLNLNITVLDQEGLRAWFTNERKKQKYFETWKRLSVLKPRGDVNRSYTSRATPILDANGKDLTRIAASGIFETSIGRDAEMGIVQNLLQKEIGSSVMVLGEPGVGKTRFIKYLATKMVAEDVPKGLQDYRLVVVDLNQLLIKVQSIDALKTVLQDIFREVSKSGNVILCIEELAQLMNIREEGKMEVVNLLVNTLDQMKLKIIATSSPDVFTKYIKPIKSFASKFELVELKEPHANIATQIMIDASIALEKKYKISIQIGAIKRIVDFGYRFDFERVMPDKGINLLEEAIIAATSKGLNYLDVTTVDELLSQKVGVNVGGINNKEAEVLQNLEKRMHERVIGQSEAIKAVASAIRRSRSGLSNTKRPVASFLFFGPTGVGKTEVAKTLADVYYGDEKLMIRLDMSEYQEEKNLDRLIGFTDPQGNFIGGYLTESVRSKPFSLVLLDEIEKANKKVLDLFLQVLDDGAMTDGLGRRVDFTNTIIIATSNAASKEIANLVSKGTSYYDVQTKVMPLVRDEFRLEFLNRFDKVIMFSPLAKLEIEKIVEIVLAKVNEGLLLRGMSIVWNNATISELSTLGYNTLYGARELRRIVQENIEDILANLIIDGSLKSGKEAVFDGLKIVEIRD